MNRDAPAYGLWGLAMFPVFGPTWNVYAARTPQWCPRIGELIGDDAPRAEGRR